MSVPQYTGNAALERLWRAEASGHPDDLRSALELAVLNAPDDPHARLRLADWLDENGHDGDEQRRIASTLLPKPDPRQTAMPQTIME